VVLDDPHVAAHHAELHLGADGRLQLRTLDTLNGVQLGRTRLVGGRTQALPPGGSHLQLGQTRLRLRLPGEVLAPEKPLPRSAALLAPLLIGVLLIAWAVADHWLTLDPGADATAWMPVLVGLPVVLLLWCGAWALASKLFQHRFDFGGHLRIALPWLLAIEAAQVVLQPLAASLAWPWLWRLASPLQVVLALLMVRAHLVHVLPQATRMVTSGVAAAGLVGAAISLTLTHRAVDRFSRPPYMSTLPLPALHVADPVSPQALVQELAPVAERLAERVKEARSEESADAEDSGE
jgi:hypothetical protein